MITYSKLCFLKRLEVKFNIFFNFAVRKYQHFIVTYQSNSKWQFFNFCTDMAENSRIDYKTNSHANRKFYDIPRKYGSKLSKSKLDETEKSSLLNYIYQNIMGHDATFDGPFGRRQILYCDYAASGQPLRFIEDFIANEVLPFYGNTHTTTSVTSLQSTLFRHEARDIIRNAVNASEHDAVIFVGTGCTSAVHKLIKALNLKQPPVVLVGPFEHHSNLLPWREVGAQVIRIKEDSNGLLDLHCLEKELKNYSGSESQLIGSFNSASNITGILTDDKAVSILLHKYGALSFWDYASAAPYVDIDMNPLITGDDQGLVYKDAIFLSPHKFVGGPDTPGLLIAKKKLFTNPVPADCGGGAVFFVSRESHRYLQEIEMREEGGTPSIIGAIRAGMVFQLKEAIGSETIMEKEIEICKKVLKVWSQIKSLKILGNTTVHRLPIFSFVIYHKKSGLLLHHNFVCSLLNDLFGIQSRGGCACSGPYAQDLLGIDESLAQYFDKLLSEDRKLDRVHLRRYREYSEREILRPGFIRINIPYFMPEEDIEFVIEAVAAIAREGWKLLPQYIFNPETGEWRHKTHQVFSDRKWLGFVSYHNGHFTYKQNQDVTTESAPNSKQECLSRAKDIFSNSSKVASRISLGEQQLLFDSKASKIRWFLLPNEAKGYLLGDTVMSVHELPFKIRLSGDDIDSDLHSNSSNISLHLENFKYEPEETEMFRSTEMCDQNILRTTLNTHTLYQLSDSSSEGIVQNSEFSGIKKNCNSDVNSKNKNTLIHNMEVPDHCNRSRCVPCAYSKTYSPLCFNEGNKSEWHSPPKVIFKPFLKAVNKFQMIKDGDRVLVCLSGGKDSLSLLHTLHQYQFYVQNKNFKFSLGAVTVDPKSPAYDPSPLKDYLSGLEIPYFYEEQDILQQAASLPQCTSICSFCSRLKRGRIYACAHREGYNVVALGQHLDDLAESFLMSLFHNGRLRTMKANYIIQKETLRIIRPFVYVREKELRKFAEKRKLPVITENCPACFEAPKERHRVKQLLAAQELLFPQLYKSIKCAMYPLMAINRTGVENKELIWQHPKSKQLHSDEEDNFDTDSI